VCPGLHWNITALNMHSCKTQGSRENIALMQQFPLQSKSPGLHPKKRGSLNNLNGVFIPIAKNLHDFSDIRMS
jgi:hypothetical protein